MNQRNVLAVKELRGLIQASEGVQNLYQDGRAASLFMAARLRKVNNVNNLHSYTCALMNHNRQYF
jgi:hypothetical protein